MNIRSEQWHGHTIRFVEKEPGEWWAVASDITSALGFARANDGTRKTPAKYQDLHKVATSGGEQDMLVLSEQGIYRMIMRSNKAEAEEFQDWAYNILKDLRKASGLEGYQVFLLTEPVHARKCTDMLRDGISNPTKETYAKASAITNRVVSLKFGYPKSIKKGAMSPEMLKFRRDVYEDTVDTMILNDKRKLGLSISETIHRKYGVPLKKAR